MGKKRDKTVLVIIPTGDYAERLKLDGILQYAQEKSGARWNLNLDIGRTVGRRLRRNGELHYDGIIAYIQSENERQTILSYALPTVLIEDLLPPTSLPHNRRVVNIVCDHRAEGRTAARYFLDRHYRNFAFVGTETNTAWGNLRREGFETELGESGLSCSCYRNGDDLENWLARLPKPCALFAVRDLRARQVLTAAGNVGLSIPQDLAILGVDNDEILCKTSLPTLSSIPTFDRSLGYAAGRALNQIFLGKTKGGVIETRHSQVVTRHSTDVDAIDDPFVAHALVWIRKHLGEKLDARTIAIGTNYSAKLLVQRTRQALGITLSEAVRRTRLATARELLANTSQSVAEIATACGFANISHLSLRITEATGLTPLAYRRQHQIIHDKDTLSASHA